MSTQTLKKSVRAGSFQDLAAADRAVSLLLKAGIGVNEITVICSDEAKEAHFQQFRHQEPAGTEAPGAVGAGVSIGAAVGGLAGIAMGAATGGVPLLIAGAAGLSGGSAMGGFLGAMLTRGGEKELSNFYDQKIRQGRILVAVEAHGFKLRTEARLKAETSAARYFWHGRCSVSFHRQSLAYPTAIATATPGNRMLGVAYFLESVCDESSSNNREESNVQFHKTSDSIMLHPCGPCRGGDWYTRFSSRLWWSNSGHSGRRRDRVLGQSLELVRQFIQPVLESLLPESWIRVRQGLLRKLRNFKPVSEWHVLSRTEGIDPAIRPVPASASAE